MSNTPRIYRNLKRISLAYTGLVGTTATSMLTDSAGNSRFDISDVNWQRVVMHSNLASIAATSTTSITFSVLTSCTPSNTGNTTDLAAVAADGSTTIKINHTASGIKGTSTGKIASAGASAATIGSHISVLATLDSSVTAAAGTVDLYIEGQ